MEATTKTIIGTFIKKIDKNLTSEQFNKAIFGGFGPGADDTYAIDPNDFR